jgi:translation elongation factor EF-Tu-like GTPase
MRRCVMTEHLVGHVTHWYGRNMVAGIHVDHGELHPGDVVHIVGHTSDLEQPVASIEIEHRVVDEAHEGDEIGIKVGDHVRERDRVYRVLH